MNGTLEGNQGFQMNEGNKISDKEKGWQVGKRFLLPTLDFRKPTKESEGRNHYTYIYDESFLFFLS